MAMMVKTYILLCIVGLCTTLFVILITYGDNHKPIPPQLHLRNKPINNSSRQLTLFGHDNFPLFKSSTDQEHGKDEEHMEKIPSQRILHENNLLKVEAYAKNQLSQRMLKENHSKEEIIAAKNSRYFQIEDDSKTNPSKHIVVDNIPASNAQKQAIINVNTKPNPPAPLPPQVQPDMSNDNKNLPDKQEMIKNFQQYQKSIDTVNGKLLEQQKNLDKVNVSVAIANGITDKGPAVIQSKLEADKPVPPVTVGETKLHIADVGSKKRCTVPQNDIALLKTHKCSSSTLQNILYRWGDARNLSFVLPKGGMPYLGNPNLFDIKYAIQANDGVYNILANHARFSETGLAKTMPTDTVYITILRNPATQYESLYNYYKHVSRYGVSLSQFLTNPTGYFYKEPPNTHIVGRNSMLFDLGLDARYMKGTDLKVSKWIQMLDNKFSLVLIAEYFAESLILLKDLLCWTMDDIVFLNQNARSKSSVTKLTTSMQQNILNWNSADTQLYTYFNQSLWRKIEAYGLDKMKQEVAVLKAKNDALSKDCIASTLKSGDPRMWYPPGVKMESFKVNPAAKNKELCARVTHPELTYMKMLADKQRKRNEGIV